MDIGKYKKVFEQCWTADTAQGKWTPECPSLNQCAVTAMVVQDLFGGDLLRCKCDDGSSHYWNRITDWNRMTDGEDVDLTFEQFEYSGIVPDKANFVVRDRAYVESFTDTMERYNRLKTRVMMKLAEGVYI